MKLSTFFASLICVVAPAHADVTIETYSSSNLTSITQGYVIIGQTFRAPAGNPTIESWQFRIDSRSGGGMLKFSIYPWAAAAAAGTALYSTNISWPPAGADIIVGSIGKGLIDGQLYAAVFEFGDYTGRSVAHGLDTYAGGTAFWRTKRNFKEPEPDGEYGEAYDLKFRAIFLPVPSFIRPLSDQISCVGGSATFKSDTVGSEPLIYQWYFNGNLLVGKTNAQLSLVNLQTNQAGLYSLAIANAFGSVTSAPSSLQVFDACMGISLYAGLNITGMVGRTYIVEAAANSGMTNWTTVATNTFAEPQWLFIDTNTPFNPQRYFRVRLQP